MPMDSTRTERHTDKTGRIRGTVQRFRSGEVHYVNFAPRFEVYYRPQKVPEELVYKRHDDLYTASGWNLQKVLDDFRTSKSVVEWGESLGPYDPNSKEPHILSLRHEWVF
jgi:hypothetical protein